MAFYDDDDDSFLSLSTESKLRRFVTRNLRPSQHFIDECRAYIDQLQHFFRKPIHVVGSYVKGTEIDERSDLDVIVYYNRFNDVHEFIDELPNTLDSLESSIRNWRQGRCYAWIERETRHALVLEMRAGENQQRVKVDILPAMDLQDTETRWQIYREMNKLSVEDREYYGPSLDPLQIHFVRDRVDRSDDLRQLILLVKSWNKDTFTSNQAAPHQHYLSSYLMELLCIHLWETNGRPKKFSLRRAFKAVMEQLMDYGNINVHWTDNYDRKFYKKSTRRYNGQPYILDPANPFDNVCGKCNMWDEVAEAAEQACESQLLYNADAGFY